MRERNGVNDAEMTADKNAQPQCGKPKDVISAYNLLRYRQIKEVYNRYGSITGQFGIEK